MTAAARRPVPAFRDVLLASYKAARLRVHRFELVLNEVSRAGELLALFGDVNAAIAAETGKDDYGLAVRAHLQRVRAEERDRDARREMPTQPEIET